MILRSARGDTVGSPQCRGSLNIFFWIQICGSVIRNYGSRSGSWRSINDVAGSYLDIFVAIENKYVIKYVGSKPLNFIKYCIFFLNILVLINSKDPDPELDRGPDPYPGDHIVITDPPDPGPQHWYPCTATLQYVLIQNGQI
jgi:hypothetical protein